MTETDPTKAPKCGDASMPEGHHWHGDGTSCDEETCWDAVLEYPEYVAGRKPRLLDLFCCAGGAARGYENAGFEVALGVDIEPQPNYPYPFKQDDALAVLDRLIDGGTVEWLSLSSFDAIHASPPCQGYLNLGGVNRAQGRTYEHDKLIAEVRERLIATGLPYVIENVADARKEMRDPVRVCGTGLGLPLRRHRMFESNLPLDGVACNHGAFAEKRYWTGWCPGGKRTRSTVVQVYGNAGEKHEWPAAMGIDWMTNDEMAEAIPPAYSEHIGRQILAHVRGLVAA